MPTEGPLVARVVVDVTGLDKRFDYLVPENLRDQVRVGTMVRVVLANRRVGGWVVSLGPPDGTVAIEKLKPIAKVRGWGPAPEIIGLAEWAAHRWCGRVRSLLGVASPPRAVVRLPADRRRAEPAQPAEGSGLTGSSGDHRTVDPRPAELGTVSVPTVSGRTGLGRDDHTSVGSCDPGPTGLGLSERAEPRPARVEPGADPELRNLPTVVRIPAASDPLAAVLAACSEGPMVVVAPSLVRVQLLAAQIGAEGLTVAVVPAQWAQAAAGVDVVVGTRVAAWAPCPGLRAVVVVDEHDEALQEERNPTWHARDVAIERARRAGARCVMISPAPSVAALEAASGRLSRPDRVSERAGWPIVDIVDMNDTEPWVTSLVTSKLIRQLRDPARLVVCVHNTPGRASRLACRSCRELTVCARCEASVAERIDGELSCGRCGATRPKVCQRCGSGALAILRPGVRRLREEVEAAAGRPAVEISGPAEPADDIPAADAGVYVGTEAVLHRLSRADTVAFLDFDAELLAPRYRAAEQAMGLLVRAARLVGPRAEGGRLLVQTRLPRHEVLDAALHADPGRLALRERQRRQSLGFPPFGALGTLAGPGADDFAAATGLVSAPLADRVLVRANTWTELADALGSTPRPPGSRVRVAIDPPRE